MLAVTSQGKSEVQTTEVDKPGLEDATDAILRVTTSALCGTDLHLYHHKIPGVEQGTILGHEFCGIVEEIGDGVTAIKPGDHVVAAMYPACGHCPACLQGDHRNCPHFRMFGFGSAFGNLPGAQAEYVRVPFADMTLRPIPEGLNDESTIFTGDILATAYTALRQAGTKEGDVVAVVGAGPVGQFIAMCAPLFGASKTFVIDIVESRLEAVKQYGAVPINATEVDPRKVIAAQIAGHGSDIVIEAAGNAKSLETAFKLVRANGKIALVGVLFDEPWPISAGMAWLRNIHIVPILGQPLLYRDELLTLIAAGRITPQEIITDRMPLTEAAAAYKAFDNHEVQKVIFEVSKP